MMRSSIIILLFFIHHSVVSQTLWFERRFDTGDTGLNERISSGGWRVEGGALKIATSSYDQLFDLSYYLFDSTPYSIEVTLRGSKAGVYFSLDDTSSKVLSHMVRFDEKNILCGYFSAAGEYTATSVFDSPKSPSEWTVLRIDVDAPRDRYTISVDGAIAGVDSNVVFPSGYIGLQASEGLCEFKSVKVYSSGPPLPPSLPNVGSKVSFEHVSFVASQGEDLVIYDPPLHCRLRLDRHGTLRSIDSSLGRPALVRTVHVAGRTFSIVGKRILITNSSSVVIDSISEHLVTPSSLAAYSGMLLIADAGAKAVFQFSAAGRLVQTIDASVLGGFKAPRGVTVFGASQIVIADYDKLVFWDEPSSQTAAVILGTDSKSCRVDWMTNETGLAWVEFAPDGQPWKRVVRPNGARLGNPTFELNDLTPLTRYSFRYSPALKTIPESFSVSRTFRFATPSADSRLMSFTRLPVMCMVYRTISYHDKYPRERFPQIPDGKTLKDDDISYLRHATEFNRDFYFRNSGCKFVLDFDFYVVEDTLWLHEVGESDPYWLSPSERVASDFERAARFFGKHPEEYAGLICPYAWVNYPPRRTSALRDPSKKDSISIRQAVGGGTYGVPAPWKYGKTAGFTANPFQDRFSRQDWLITHEFHHQIDALMDVSGYPEYYHADQPWKMPGRFGEDFDFNAHIIREAEQSRWLTLRFGKLGQTLDADHDGVPDDDPTLPFDEKRLGGNPNSQDTDGDGVPDLTEVMMGTSRNSALNNADTDGDGLPDNHDPEPLYPIQPGISKLRAAGELDLHPFGSIHDTTMSATFYIAWTDSALLVSAITDKPANLLVQIDAGNDGWFHGFDNFQIRVLNTGDTARAADYYLRDCSSWVDPPKDRRDILRISDLVVRSEKIEGIQSDQGNRYRLTLYIPGNDRYAFRMEQRKRFSIRLGLQTTTDLWVWDELFERNYMMQVELK